MVFYNRSLVNKFMKENFSLKLLTLSKLFLLLGGLFSTIISIKNFDLETYGNLVFVVALSYFIDMFFSGKFDINILKSDKADYLFLSKIVKGSFIILIFTSPLIFIFLFLDNFFMFLPLIAFVSGIQSIFQILVNKFFLKFDAYRISVSFQT